MLLIHHHSFYLIIKEESSKKEFIIGMSGVGFVTKGGFVLLDAIRRLKNNYPNIRAKIIYPKHKNNLGLKLYMLFSNLNGYVEFLGYQKNMQEFYTSLDCFVCPSIQEAFGRVVTEAMNFKIPTVVSSTTGAKDIIKNEVNGFIFERKNYSGKNLANKIEYIIKNPDKMKPLTEAAYITAQEITWENFAKTIFKEFYPELNV